VDSKHDYKKTYSVFDKVRMEMPNWTGYNAELLDELVEIGNELLADNNEKEKTLSFFRKENNKENVVTVFQIIAWVCVAVFCIGGLWTCVTKQETTFDNLGLAYKQGQVDVLTGEQIVYESTIHGYQIKEAFKNYTKEVMVRERSAHFFQIKDGDKSYNLYLEE
jgi:hypothetical protein